MTREEALKRVSELSCAYQHVRMTECPHCAKDVEMLVRDLMEMEENKLSEGKRHFSSINGNS